MHEEAPTGTMFKREFFRWRSDREPSSWDVLLEWLEAPGNYERWKQEKNKSCKEVVSLLREAGIQHRSERAVEGKIRWIEQRWDTATKWLNESGLFVAYQIGGVDDDIRSNVNKLCPEYDRVTRARSKLSDTLVGIEDEADEEERDGEHTSQIVGKKWEKPRGGGAEKKFCIEDEDRRHRQKIFKCELEAKKVETEVNMVCSNVLGRNRLLKAGISEAIASCLFRECVTFSFLTVRERREQVF
ncbi:unnamed protein product [Phytophthora lilii]|uniref:Unnamed protein product n=1 Tax=Phytophthora lilii TaxID=2077276 RepID=A0A9W6Y0K4_9STRA|nr:unnamed protein product [Phytophthora lilii]